MNHENTYAQGGDIFFLAVFIQLGYYITGLVLFLQILS